LVFWDSILERPMLNFTIMLHESCKAAVNAFEAQGKNIDSLAEMVLQKWRGLNLLTASQGGLCVMFNETLSVHKYLRIVEANLEKKIKKILQLLTG
jgi:hypothetical protein